MLQSTHLDLVVGLDVHIVALPVPPSPVPVPTPIPLPFMGMVFDPGGVLLGAAIGMATGSGPELVLVNGLPATNCGTGVTNALTLPHVSAPGLFFLSSGMPVMEGDAELVFGSYGVSLGGSYGVRHGDIALSCSDPVRLPTSMVMAIPKGAPVLNLPAMVPDVGEIAESILKSLALGALAALGRRGARLFRRWRAGSSFMRRTSGALGGCTPTATASRWRQMWSRAVRTVTGHPVDVVTGNLFTDLIDVELPGPLPLAIERVYESAGSAKAGALGYGWSHTLDESLWMERGRMVVRCGDGRELEFPLWDLPDRVMRTGDLLKSAIHRMTLRRLDMARFEVEQADGRVHEYAPVAGGAPGIARLVRIRSRDGHHAIELTYDARGRLEWVRDSAGRLLRFEHDPVGRLTAISLPLPHGRGWYRHRQYVYDGSGDLVEAKDAAGCAWRYLYRGHLLVQETDRAGLSFYFQYDGQGASAKCVRTWGDGGIYDHAITYDAAKRKTFVESSLGATTIYAFDARNQVIAITDANGATTRFEHDPATGEETLEIDPLGARTERQYDASGNLVAMIAPDGATTRIRYEGSQPIEAIDPRGGRWTWRYDRGGRLIERTDPVGQRTVLGWERGLLRVAEVGPGRRVSIEHDDRGNVASITLPTGATERYERDALGRPVKIVRSSGAVIRLQYDAEGRVLAVQSATGGTQRFAYDAEGNVLEARDATRHVRMGYGHFHRVVWREEGGARLELQYDTEDRLIAVTNEAGERYQFVLDATGRASEEIGFDGRARIYLRDACGRVIDTILPSGRRSRSAYDAAGRVTEVRHSDGTFARFERDAAGAVIVAENEAARIDIERDALGRVVAERVGDREVCSRYDASGERVEMRTSLGARVRIERDALGAVRELSFGDRRGAPDVSIERDALGLEVARRFASGIDVEWSRDLAGRPTARRTSRRGAAGLAAATALAILGAPSSGSAQLESRTYQWRGDDQIAAILDPISGDRAFDHDARGRLIRERRADGAIERAMDLVGNVYRDPAGRDRRYGAGGRLELADGARYEHDADGNRTRRIDPDGSEWRYAWNGHGMLREVVRPDGRRVEHDYDVFARRIAKRTVDTEGRLEQSTEFVWDGQVVVHELDSERGATTWHWDPGTFAPVAKEHAGRTWSITTDHLGTPTEMYDELGDLAWKMQLDVFGVAAITVGRADECPWRWPGQYEDPETGLYYNRARHYAPDEGGYPSADPLGTRAGLRLHGYPGDPLCATDPLGLIAVVIGEGQYAVDEATSVLRDAGYDVESMKVPRDQWRGGRLGVDPLDRAVRWNRAWMENKIRAGYDVVDIGRDSQRSVRSVFYEAELEALAAVSGGRRIKLRVLPGGETIDAMRARIKNRACP
jgi:RHS repeat-associated protein